MTQEEIELKEWHKIGDTLTEYFGICGCQRKLKTIVDNLHSIYIKLKAEDFNFTGAEWLLIALIEKQSTAITHGVNCEYPIIMENDHLWKWVVETKDSPYLKDN